MTITLRPVEPEQDYPPVAALLNTVTTAPRHEWAAPMLVINRNLGYQPLSRIDQVVKPIVSTQEG